jgi:hypothetical protein
MTVEAQLYEAARTLLADPNCHHVNMHDRFTAAADEAFTRACNDVFFHDRRLVDS